MKRSIIIIFSLFLSGAAFAQVPIIYSITPDSAEQGQSISVMISGAGFTPGVTASFGTGITVIGTFYITPNFVRVDISVALNAPLGRRDVIIVLPTGAADTLEGGFRVVENDRFPPTAGLITPPRFIYVSCPETSIVIVLRDENGIDPASVVLRVEGVDYRLTDSELRLVDDSILVFTPSEPFPNGERVDVVLVGLADTIGNAIRPGSPALEFYYRIDSQGPVPNLVSPENMSSTRELQPVISISFDDINSVEHSSVEIVIQGISYRGDDASIRWVGDTLRWLSNRAGVVFNDGDTVSVCVTQAYDTLSFCPPNGLDSVYCWRFFVRIPPPMDINLSIEQIASSTFPVIKLLCTVVDEEERTISYLNESNFVVYENGIREYPIIVQDLGGTGRVDIVFAIDTTGSMSGIIRLICDRVIEFADSLAMSGINYRLGLVTFGDGTNFPHGTGLTGDVYAFRSWVAALGAAGGGDTPETSLDAIYDGVNLCEFRPGARIVIIMITDAEPHYRGDGTPYSRVTLGETIDALLTHDAVCFVVGPDDPFYHGSGSLTDATGGTWYHINDPFNAILASIAENIRGGYYILYTTHSPVGDCTDRSVRVVVNAFGLSDDDNGDYMAPCSPLTRIIEPLPNTITSNARQRIRINISDLEADIDFSSVQLYVNGRLYTSGSPNITFSRGELVFTPPAPFSNNQQVNVNLARVLDVQGNSPIGGPLIWRFWVDLEGPRAFNLYPTPDTLTYRTSPPIRFSLTDNLSGVDPASILVMVESFRLDTNFVVFVGAPGVSYGGGIFSFYPNEAGISFRERDTVTITILRVNDRPYYGEPNELFGGTTRWSFYILDDDTIGPSFSDFSPETARALTPFFIQCRITDPSGIYDDTTGSSGQGVYLWWDIDGDVFDGTYYEVQLENIGDNIFRTVEPIPGVADTANFVYIICAYDNDFDFEDPADRTLACSRVLTVVFTDIYGPIAEIVHPFSGSVVADSMQPVVIYLTDNNRVDPRTIRLSVDGYVLGVTDPRVRYENDTLYYFPSGGIVWHDGDSVRVELLAAQDIYGNELQTPLRWSFFVDLTGPVASNPIPQNGSVIEDSCSSVSFRLFDRHRSVDISTIRISIGGVIYRMGEDGLSWDAQNGRVIFDPRVSGRCFAMAETVVVELVEAYDIPPDYGEPNRASGFRFWFVYYVPPPTVCADHPDPFTPNGDGYNDVVYFTYPHMERRNCIIKIYTSESELVRTLPYGVNWWDGKDDNGRQVRRGLYLYTISASGDVVCSGTVLLIR